MGKSVRECEFNRDELGSSPRLTIHFDCQNTTLHKLEKKKFLSINNIFPNQYNKLFPWGESVPLIVAEHCTATSVWYSARQQLVGHLSPMGCVPMKTTQEEESNRRNKPPWAVEPKRFLQARQWGNLLGNASLIATSWVQVPD